MTNYAGMCGKWTKGIGSNRCDRHLGKEEKPKKETRPKFRGDSSWQKENGMFTNK